MARRLTIDAYADNKHFLESFWNDNIMQPIIRKKNSQIIRDIQNWMYTYWGFSTTGLTTPCYLTGEPYEQFSHESTFQPPLPYDWAMIMMLLLPYKGEQQPIWHQFIHQPTMASKNVQSVGNHNPNVSPTWCHSNNIFFATATWTFWKIIQIMTKYNWCHTSFHFLHKNCPLTTKLIPSLSYNWQGIQLRTSF